MLFRMGFFRCETPISIIAYIIVYLGNQFLSFTRFLSIFPTVIPSGPPLHCQSLVPPAILTLAVSSKSDISGLQGGGTPHSSPVQGLKLVWKLAIERLLVWTTEPVSGLEKELTSSSLTSAIPRCQSVLVWCLHPSNWRLFASLAFGNK